MKKSLIAILAAALLLSAICGQALASTGDVTTREVKAYGDPAMLEYVGTIPAYTALAVRAYDSYADVYYNGRTVYISASALLRRDLSTRYSATLKKGTKVYQRPTTLSDAFSLKKSGAVHVCAVSGDWALVQSMGDQGLYAFVKLSRLSDIKAE